MPGAHVQVGLLELGPKCGMAEAFLALGIQVVPLRFGAAICPPVAVLILNSPYFSISKAFSKRSSLPCGRHRVQAGKSFIFPSSSEHNLGEPCVHEVLRTLTVKSEQCGAIGELWAVHNMVGLELSDIEGLRGFSISWETAVAVVAAGSPLIGRP